MMKMIKTNYDDRVDRQKKETEKRVGAFKKEKQVAEIKKLKRQKELKKKVFRTISKMEKTKEKGGAGKH